MDFETSNNMIFAGVSIDLPFPDQVDRAEHHVAKIEEEKQGLHTNTVYHQLYENLYVVSLSFLQEKELLSIADKKITLSQSVLGDESENYTFGKITLNDYIDAVNKRDENLFNKIAHVYDLKRYTIEWLRLTDTLVTRRDIDARHTSCPSR